MSVWFIEAQLKPGIGTHIAAGIAGRNPNHCPAKGRLIWRCRDVGEANRIFVNLHSAPASIASVSRRMQRKGFAGVA